MIEAERSEPSGSFALDDQVGVQRQRSIRRSPLIGVEIHRHVRLAGVVPPVEHAAQRIGGGVDHRATPRPSPRSPDYLGSCLGEQFGAEPAEVVGEVDHPQTAERSVVGASP